MTLQNKISERLRSFREKMEMTVAELSERSGVPETVIIAVELGDVIPVVGVLYKLSKALGVRLGTFMDDQYQKGPVITRADNRGDSAPTGYDGANPIGFTYYSLARGKPDRHMDPFYIELTSGASEKLSSSEGESLIICSSGKIELVYGEEKFILGTGDSAYYNNVVPRTIRAVDGKPAAFIGVSYMPF